MSPISSLLQTSQPWLPEPDAQAQPAQERTLDWMEQAEHSTLALPRSQAAHGSRSESTARPGARDASGQCGAEPLPQPAQQSEAETQPASKAGQPAAQASTGSEPDSSSSSSSSSGPGSHPQAALPEAGLLSVRGADPMPGECGAAAGMLCAGTSLRLLCRPCLPTHLHQHCNAWCAGAQ